MIFYTYIRTEGVRIFVIISLIQNEFSYGKSQIPHCSKPLSRTLYFSTVFFHTTSSKCILSLLEFELETTAPKHKTLRYSFAAYKHKVYALYRMEIR